MDFARIGTVTAAVASLSTAIFGSGCASNRPSAQHDVSTRLAGQMKPNALDADTIVLQVNPSINEHLPGVNGASSTMMGTNVWYINEGNARNIPLSMGARVSWTQATKIAIEVVNQDGTATTLPPLPGEQNANLLTFIKEGPSNILEYDCACFAHFIAGESYTYGQFDPRKWSFEERTNNRHFKAGEIVLLGNSMDEFTHFAICVGEVNAEPIFLSRFGSSFSDANTGLVKAPTAFTTLTQMATFYDMPREVWVLTKKF